MCQIINSLHNCLIADMKSINPIAPRLLARIKMGTTKQACFRGNLGNLKLKKNSSQT